MEIAVEQLEQNWTLQAAHVILNPLPCCMVPAGQVQVPFAKTKVVSAHWQEDVLELEADVSLGT